MIEVEKMGKPGVPIVSGRFEGDAIASSRAFGMPELQFVVVPRIYRNLPLDECVSQTELAFDQVVSTLTSNGEASRWSINAAPTRRTEISRATTGMTPFFA